MDQFAELKRINEQNALKASDDAKHFELVDSLAQTQEVILRSFSSLVDYLDGKVSRTEVVNQLEQIGTPDAYVVADAVNKLHESFIAKPDLDISELASVLTEIRDQATQIPKELPVIPEQEKQIDYSDRFTTLESAVNAITEAVKEQETTVEAPIVNVPETNVNVDAPDLKPINKGLKDVEKAVKALVFPEYKTDNAEVEKLLKTTNKTLKGILEKPVGGGGGGGGRATPYQDAAGVPAFVELTVSGEVPVSDTSLEALLTTIDADTGNLAAIATSLDNRYGGGKTPVNFTVTASGDTTIHTPASGKAVVLYSISAITDPDESTTPLIKVLIGATEVRRGHAISGWEISTGAADAVLKINLSGASSVSGTAFIKEITP